MGNMENVAEITVSPSVDNAAAAPKVRYGYGIKALTAWGTTENDHGSFAYILPRPDQKWGDVMTHPEPAERDGQDCGYGRYHLMKKLDKRYAPKAAWFWLARYRLEDVVGESDEKVSVRALQLRRITEVQFHKLIRRGWAVGANLDGANLRSANLYGANLYGANLRSANLYGANLYGANLEDANLEDANLDGANLRSANLYGANLYGANLEDANLDGAYLVGANLRSAKYSRFTTLPTDFDPDQHKMIKV